MNFFVQGHYPKSLRVMNDIWAEPLFRPIYLEAILVTYYRLKASRYKHDNRANVGM